MLTGDLPDPNQPLSCPRHVQQQKWYIGLRYPNLSCLATAILPIHRKVVVVMMHPYKALGNRKIYYEALRKALITLLHNELNELQRILPARTPIRSGFD